MLAYGDAQDLGGVLTSLEAAHKESLHILQDVDNYGDHQLGYALGVAAATWAFGLILERIQHDT